MIETEDYQMMNWAMGFCHASEQRNRYSIDPDYCRQLKVIAGDRISFYRGIVDCIASIKICFRNNMGNNVPHVMLRAGDVMLWSLLEYFYEKWAHFDKLAKLANQIQKSELRFYGSQAAEFLELLYPNAHTFGIPAHVEMAQRCRGWVPRWGTKEHLYREELKVSRMLAQGLTKSGQRIAWEHLRPF